MLVGKDAELFNHWMHTDAQFVELFDNLSIVKFSLSNAVLITRSKLNRKDVAAGKHAGLYWIAKQNVTDEGLKKLTEFVTDLNREAILLADELVRRALEEKRWYWKELYLEWVYGNDMKFSQDRENTGRKKGNGLSPKTKKEYREIYESYLKSGLSDSDFVKEYPSIKRSKLSRAKRHCAKK
jgi:hypothetical protein